MSEVSYSKKQIGPLVEKYKIDVENNIFFKNIISMFDGTPNYQVWAIKMVFGGKMSYDTLSSIAGWMKLNKDHIKMLKKKNIVSYSSQNDVSLLNCEIRGIDKILKVKSFISKFNTKQRKMLNDSIKIDDYTPELAANSYVLDNHLEMIKKFENLPLSRRQKFISLASAYTSASDLIDGINSCLSDTYQWDRDDMLAFMKNNASDCKVVYDKDNIVIVSVPSFNSSQKLCGGGRTGWCITREDNYFKNYVTSYSNHTQYFMFNFNKPETDELAHVGFTVEGNRGVVNAHSTKNHNLIGDGFKYHGKNINISGVFDKFNLSMSMFIKLKDRNTYAWSLESLENLISKCSDLSIAYVDNNRAIIKVTGTDGLKKLVGHTYIQTNSSFFNNGSVVFVMVDFNLDENSDKSVIMLNYHKDKYGFESLFSVIDAFGNNIANRKYLETIGISTDLYFKRRAIDVNIMLHKLIDEGSEAEAIKLISDNSDKIDVNYVFNSQTPVFSAIYKRMFNLFRIIVCDKKFDSTAKDRFGEPLLHCLLYVCGSEKNRIDNKEVVKMIDAILESENFNFNSKDINLDTPLSIACEKESLLWVVKALLKKDGIDINAINDYDCSALGNAIRRENVKAIKELGKRSDLIVREEDKKRAARLNINLNELIKPTKEFNTTVAVISPNGDVVEGASELFAKVFSAKKAVKRKA